MRGVRLRDFGNQWYGGGGAHAWKISSPVPGSRQRVAAAVCLARGLILETKVEGIDSDWSGYRPGTDGLRPDTGRAMFSNRERVQHGV